MRRRISAGARLPYPVEDHGLSQNLQHILSMVQATPVDRATEPGVSRYLDRGDVSGAVTINWADAPVQRVRLTGGTTLNVTGMVLGGTYALIIEQAAAHTLTWGTGFLWPQGDAPPISDTAGRLDVATFVSLPWQGGVRAGGVLQWDFR